MLDTEVYFTFLFSQSQEDLKGFTLVQFGRIFKKKNMIKIDIQKKLSNIKLKINENISQNSFTVLFGESGAGKTSILNILAGISEPDSGEIIVGDEVWFSSKKKINLPPQKREIGYLFQDYALFPNMTVFENIKFANSNISEIQKIIKIVGLQKLQNEKPDNLSGGQKQRVALARAVVRKPKLLLLDEPLSALDLKMRENLQDKILEIFENFNITVVLVSHDISEIQKLATDILQIEQGKVIKKGTPKEIFQENIIFGKIEKTLENNRFIIEIPNQHFTIGQRVKIC